MKLIDTITGLGMAADLSVATLIVLAVGSLGVLALRRWRPLDHMGSADHCHICTARRLKLLPDRIVDPEGALSGANLPFPPKLNQV